MELHGCDGCGSAVVEALLELAGVDYVRHHFAWEDRDGWDRLRRVNPLGQVPTLVLDDGTVMTESAGIALWIAGEHPRARLLPDAPAARALANRWMVSFATNVYAPIIIGDFPERWVDGDDARTDLKAKALQRLGDAWRAFEGAVSPAPYVLGDRMSVVDVYLAMLSRWRPGRAWLDQHCPATMAAVRLTEAHPVVARVWSRNFR